MCSNFDPRTRENPEAAMLHEPSAAFLDHPHDWVAASNALNRVPELRGDPTKWEWPTSESFAKPEVGTPINVLPRTDKPEPGTLPGFDSEAHRSFMRSLG